jgi:hypothetical protein
MERLTVMSEEIIELVLAVIVATPPFSAIGLPANSSVTRAWAEIVWIERESRLTDRNFLKNEKMCIRISFLIPNFYRAGRLFYAFKNTLE